MKNLKYFMSALVLGASVLVACGDKNGNNNSNPPTPPSGGDEEEVLEDAPALDAPGKGNVTIALRAPKGTCNGIVLVGAGLGADCTDDWTPGAQTNKFAAVEGTETWYAITVPYCGSLAVKAIAVAENGVADWGTQWGMNTDDATNVAIVEGNAVIDNSENGGEVKLTSLEDNSVVYVSVAAWKSEPCVAKNEAGKAVFTMVAPALPEGCSVYVIGNFENENWNWGDASTATTEMTFADGKYTLEVEVPASFEYKYFYKTAEGVTSWDNGEDSDNRQMPLDLKANDEVSAWKGEHATVAE